MKRNLAVFAALAISLSVLSACKVKQGDAEADAQATTQATETPGPTVTPAASAGFSVDSVPVTTVSLPPFPFFEIPEGLTSTFTEKQRTVPFDGQYFMVGDKPTLVEGKIFHDRFSLTQERPYSELEFHRNYENAITALGGKKISTAQYTGEITQLAGGRAVLDKYNYGAAPAPTYRHESYLLRTPGKEYWIEISTGSFPLHGYVVVLERTGMAQSVGFLNASQMKQELDRTGRVALYVNFDVDKATLRPDANSVLAEVNKLLTQDPKLRLSIEGHTDNTGNAQHNRDLSTARARSVLGALVGMGIDPARLGSKGFGPDKPIADNGSEDGRAKNRRVELVKT